MEILLGLGSAITYGAADFLGGLASRRTSVLAVVLLSQIAGSAVLVGLVVLVDSGPLSGAAVGWGALAGVAGNAGVIGLYFGLAVGRMSVVAPVTAVVAACVPLLFGLASGERPSAIALVGAAVALAAVVLVSLSAEPSHDLAPERAGGGSKGDGSAHRSGVFAALGAGVAFGAFFILLERAPHDSGLWPLVGARSASIAIVGALVLMTTTSLEAGRGSGHLIASAGVLDVVANLMYLLASRRGLLSLVAVLTSMYPASTVVLARVVLGERLTPSRVVGLVAAGAGVALIAAG